MNYKVLRRPMFRIGGGVDSQGTGITSGMDTPRQNYSKGTEYRDYLEMIPGLFEKRRETLENLKGSLGPLALMKMAQSGAFQNVGSLFDIPGAIGSPEAIGATIEGLATMPKIDLKMDTAALEEASTMAKLLKPEKATAVEQKLALTGKAAMLLKNSGGWDNMSNEDQTSYLNMLTIALGSGAPMSRSEAYESARKEVMNTEKVSGVPIPAKKREEMINELALSIFRQGLSLGLEDKPGGAQGGRVGLQDSYEGTVGDAQQMMQPAQNMQAMQPAQNMQGMTTTQNQAMTEDSYQLLRRRLPPEVSDDVVRLIAYNKEAFQDFSNIQTQDDVTMFNDKWGVQLVVDVGSA